MIMFDTNVVIDLREPSSPWRGWAERTLAEARFDGRVAVSVVVIGELAGGDGEMEDSNALIRRLGFDLLTLSVDAAFLAGRAQRAYRLAGGRREHLLGAFLIGGHAMSLGAALATRDARRYRQYFPNLTLITSETTHG